jgi:hypothetical protein
MAPGSLAEDIELLRSRLRGAGNGDDGREKATPVTDDDIRRRVVGALARAARTRTLTRRDLLALCLRYGIIGGLVYDEGTLVQMLGYSSRGQLQRRLKRAIEVSGEEWLPDSGALAADGMDDVAYVCALFRAELLLPSERRATTTKALLAALDRYERRTGLRPAVTTYRADSSPRTSVDHYVQRLPRIVSHRRYVERHREQLREVLLAQDPPWRIPDASAVPDEMVPMLAWRRMSVEHVVRVADVAIAAFHRRHPKTVGALRTAMAFFTHPDFPRWPDEALLERERWVLHLLGRRFREEGNIGVLWINRRGMLRFPVLNFDTGSTAGCAATALREHGYAGAVAGFANGILRRLTDADLSVVERSEIEVRLRSELAAARLLVAQRTGAEATAMRDVVALFDECDRYIDSAPQWVRRNAIIGSVRRAEAGLVWFDSLHSGRRSRLPYTGSDPAMRRMGLPTLDEQLLLLTRIASTPRYPVWRMNAATVGVRVAGRLGDHDSAEAFLQLFCRAHADESYQAMSERQLREALAEVVPHSNGVLRSAARDTIEQIRLQRESQAHSGPGRPAAHVNRKSRYESN